MPSEPLGDEEEDIDFTQNKEPPSKMTNPSFPVVERLKEVYFQYVTMLLTSYNVKDLMM